MGREAFWSAGSGQRDSDGAGSAWDELKHVRQAIGFLVLSVQQLYRICTLYWDDKYNMESVSEEVMSSMRELMTEDANTAVSSSFLLDDNSSKGQAADTPAGYVCRLGYVSSPYLFVCLGYVCRIGYVSSPYRICVGVKELASAIVVLPPIRVGRIIGAFIIELMDENTVRLWLKEQQDAAERLAQQQAATFQAQIEALRAEIQVATRVIQTRHGGGGDQGLLLPRSMRLDVPKFSGVDPESWLFSINEYFTLLNTPADQRLRIVGFNLEGAAAKWFRWMTRNGLITDWPRFEESVKNRFGPSKYEDPQGALSKLLQTGTVAEYQGEFEKLMNRVTDISEALLISFYISGLKLSLQRELLVSKPTTLGDAFALARVTEARLEDQANVNPTAKPLAIKWISPAERQERLSKGLCFNCDNRWTRGHKCPGKFLLLMTDSVEDTGEDLTAEEDEAVESGDISILNSLVGHGSPRSLQLWGKIGTTAVHILIDNGSTHNFVRPGVVERMHLPLQATKVFKVYIGSGESLLCESVCSQVTLHMQSLDMEVDLYVLPMQGPNVVLGIQWLQKLGKVTHDYAQQVMEFTLSGAKYTLKGDESLRMKKISLHWMQALLETDEVYGIYECHGFALGDKEDRGVATSPTPSGQPELDQLLAPYDSLFQIPTCLPPSRVVDHRIHLLPNTKSVNVRPYRYPHYQKGKMEKLVNEMLSQGIIRFSHSPFSSPVLLVKKKDGSYRFCVDYRALNSVTVKDKFPIPTADKMFDELGGASIFTKFDLRVGYHQIRVHERDVYKTSFRTHDGHYEFLVMPFGITNAPSTFQATMNRLFSPYLRKFVIVFFDDILVYSTTLRLHLEHLECVFHCLQKHQFYVKCSKCVFGSRELEYLGHIISARGVEMDPKKLSAVQDWPEPKNQRQLRGFLGLAGYYRRFIQGYASLAAPLTDLLKHEGFKWGEAEIRAFKDLKERLSNAPLLSLPNFDREFVIEADASGDGIGAVLMQENRPISYFSQKLGPRMRVAATYQKELFAIVEAVYKWRQYLLGRRFTIRTDHKSIKELMQQVVQTPLQQKYVRKLMGFDFSIEYKTGSANRAADALSRVFEEDDQLSASFMAFSQPLVGLVGELRGENEALVELRDLHRRMDNGDELSGFRREDGLLIYNDRYYIGQESKLKPLLLQEFHATPSAGHGGIKKTLVGLLALFFWKGMCKSVEEFVKKCVVCQQIKYSTEAPGGYLQPLPTPTAVWEDVSMDFITGLPSSKGSTVIIVVVDRLTKYAHFGALSTNFNALKVAEIFLDIVVKHHGIPKTIVSDRDTIFWVRFLPWAEYCYNSNYHSSIKMSPFQALYGRPPLHVIPYPLGSSKVATVDELLVERDRLLRQLKESLLMAKHKMEVKANRKRRYIEFKVRDLVLVKLQPYRQVTLAKRLSNKLAKRYYGPYKVEARVGKVAYRLALPALSKIHPVFHVSILKAFVAAYPTYNLEDKIVFEDGGNDTPARQGDMCQVLIGYVSVSKLEIVSKLVFKYLSIICSSSLLKEFASAIMVLLSIRSRPREHVSFSINEYYTLLNTLADQRLRIVGFNLEGAVAKWFRWMTRNGLITDSPRYGSSANQFAIPSGGITLLRRPPVVKTPYFPTPLKLIWTRGNKCPDYRALNSVHRKDKIIPFPTADKLFEMIRRGEATMNRCIIAIIQGQASLAVSPYDLLKHEEVRTSPPLNIRRATNRAADALSRVFEEDEQLSASFMAFSQPLVGLVGELRGENEALVELRDLHRRMDNGDELSGAKQYIYGPYMVEHVVGKDDNQWTKPLTLCDTRKFYAMEVPEIPSFLRSMDWGFSPEERSTLERFVRNSKQASSKPINLIEAYIGLFICRNRLEGNVTSARQGVKHPSRLSSSPFVGKGIRDGDRIFIAYLFVCLGYVCRLGYVSSPYLSVCLGYVCRIGYVSSPYRICVGVKVGDCL
ncbi:ty3-gypsy retrotransposon protein [Tanacetum coccineum]